MLDSQGVVSINAFAPGLYEYKVFAVDKGGQERRLELLSVKVVAAPASPSHVIQSLPLFNTLYNRSPFSTRCTIAPFFQHYANFWG